MSEIRTTTEKDLQPTFSQRSLYDQEVDLGLHILKREYPGLFSKISETKLGDAGLFTDEELVQMVDVFRWLEQQKEQPGEMGTMDSRFLTAYAEFRWGKSDVCEVVASERVNGVEKVGSLDKVTTPLVTRQEFIGPMFWGKITGNDKNDRDVNRVRFFMNLSQEEAIQYANKYFAPIGKLYKFPVTSER